MFDDHSNFAHSLVAAAPSPATTGLSLTVTTGEGAIFPAPPFNTPVWPNGVQPTISNAEIIRVTNIVGDVFTIVRTQEGSSARSISVGDQIGNNITKKWFTDIESLLVAKAGSVNIDVNDNYQRITVVDSSVLSTSKIIGTIKQPNVEDVDDEGWLYNCNVVKVTNGSFDIVVASQMWGQDSDKETEQASTNFVRESYEPVPSSNSGLSTAADWSAQSFVAPISGKLRAVWLLTNIQTVTPPIVGELIIDIRTDSAGSPGSSSIGTSFISCVNMINSAFGFAWSRIPLPDIAVVAGTTYWIVGHLSDSNISVSVLDIGGVIPGGYANGVAKISPDSGGLWVEWGGAPAGDLGFRADIVPTRTAVLNYLVL